MTHVVLGLFVNESIFSSYKNRACCIKNIDTNFKMFKAALIASLATSTVAFSPAVPSRFSAAKLSMTAEGLAGQTAPLGYFDPLGTPLQVFQS